MCAFGNKFVTTKNEAKPQRVKVKNPQGVEYTIDPWKDPAQMKPWELTAAIRYFMDLSEALQKKKSRPNRFVHVQRH
jgi:hypothetical protein